MWADESRWVAWWSDRGVNTMKVEREVNED